MTSSAAVGGNVTDPRNLPAHPTFADLVDAVRKLDDASLTRSEAGCLLRGSRQLRLEADLSVGVRPLPAAPAELAGTLDQAAGPATVLSTWGVSAGEALKLSLVAFTTTTTQALQRPQVALLLTHKGVYLRGADAISRAHPEAMPLATAVSWLAQPGAQEPATIYVSAEAAVPLTQVRELLQALPARYEVALAVALPKDTRLPELGAHASDLLCPQGLSELAPDAPEGDLPASVLQAALSPLREAALECAQSTAGRASLGGRLVLDLRVGPDGKPVEICVEHDEIAELALRRCLVESARNLQLPQPKPAGYVDLSLPLRLQLQGPTAQRSLCE
jgi:hypothetical protein